MNKLKPFAIATHAAISLMLAANAHAVEMADTFQVHGFMSQALIVTDHNDFFGPSSEGGGSWEYTELGLNASFRPLSNVLVAGQLLARQAGDDGELNDPELDYGVVDYQFLTDNENTVGVQFGRFKNPFGLYNQARDVAITRPSILLPQSIYFDRTRKPALSSDGVMGYVERRMDNSVVRFQVGVGNPRFDSQVAGSLLGSNGLGDFSGETSYIGQIRYEYGGGAVVLALTNARVKAKFESAEDEPGDGDFLFEPWIFSFQYNQENWSFTTEYALRDLKTEKFTDPYNYNVTGESWYLQYSRRLSSYLDWIVRYDSYVVDRGDRRGRSFAEQSSRPAFSRYAKDWTTGLQWQVYPRFLLSSELHHIEGTGWLPVVGEGASESQDKYWNMLLLQASYFF
ncbi:hypothetical protein [Salinicola sp. CR57]|uniref:hypothetical protein n=1 Tax=Salinicola sp. CR57 TaxID=1949086 RepID=UPI001E4EFD7F|nr:hypothetical protein [Salinicola sp. CR57]